MLKTFETNFTEFKKKQTDAEEALKKQIDEYEKQVHEYRAKIKSLETSLEKKRIKYLKTIKDIEESKKNDLITEQEKSKKQFNDGDLSFEDYSKKSLTKEQINKQVRLEMTNDVKKHRESTQKKAVVILDLYGKIFDKNHQINILINKNKRRYIEFLEKAQNKLKKTSPQLITGNQNDWAMIKCAREGKSQPILFDHIESWDQLELFPTRGAIQSTHFEAFDRMVLDIRKDGIDFKTHYLRITYYSIPFLRDPGFDYTKIRRP